MPERQKVQSPFGQRETRYSGPRVTGSNPNPNNYNPKSSNIPDLVNSLSNLAGVGASMYIDHANKKANTDRILQTGRAIKGEAPTNDATNAGYKAHTAVKLQGDLARSKAELKQLAETNPSEDIWEDAVARHYEAIDNNVINDYKTYGVDDAEVIKDLNKLTSLGMAGIMPEVTSYRELKKVEGEETARKGAGLDTIVTEFKANPNTPPADIAKKAESQLGALRLSPPDQDAVMVNSVITSRDPRMVEASKNFYNGRKTSLYERTAALQKMDSNLKAAMANDNVIEMGTFKSALEEKLYNGDISLGAFETQADAGLKRWPKLYTDDQYKGVLDKAKTEVRKRFRANAISTKMAKGEALPADVTGAEKKASLEHDYTIMSEQLEANTVGLPDDQAQQAQELGMKRINALIADRSVQYGTPFDKFKTELSGFANMNVLAVEEGSPEYESVVANIGERGDNMKSLLNGMTASTKQFYLDALPKKEGQTMRIFDMYSASGLDPAYALKNAQKAVQAPKVQAKNAETMESSEEMVDTVFSEWLSLDNKPMMKHLSQEAFNLKNLYPDPGSDYVDDHVTEYFKKAYTSIGGGLAVKGTAEYYQNPANGGLHPSHLKTAFDAAIQTQKAAIEPQLMGGDIDDVFPVVNTDTGMITFQDADNNIVGQAVPVKELPDILADYQEQAEKSAWGFWKALKGTDLDDNIIDALSQ